MDCFSVLFSYLQRKYGWMGPGRKGRFEVVSSNSVPTSN